MTLHIPGLGADGKTTIGQVTLGTLNSHKKKIKLQRLADITEIKKILFRLKQLFEIAQTAELFDMQPNKIFILHPSPIALGDEAVYRILAAQQSMALKRIQAKQIPLLKKVLPYTTWEKIFLTLGFATAIHFLLRLFLFLSFLFFKLLRLGFRKRKTKTENLFTFFRNTTWNIPF